MVWAWQSTPELITVTSLVYVLTALAVAILLNLAPGIGTLAASVGGVMLAATIVCLDFLDAPLERRRLPFREKLGIVFGSLPASASFSLICLGLVSVPLLNLLTIPLCVASGTLFFCDRIYPKLPKPPSLPNSKES
jgi:CysZ protein